MRRTALMLGLTLAVGVTLGVIGGQVLNAQQEAVKRTALLKTDLEGIEGKEGNVVMVEIAPGASTGRHYHPGHEFAYVLAGSGTLEIEGKAPLAIKPGAIAHLTPKQVHNAKNTGKTSLKVLVFAIYGKGEPPVTQVK